MISVIVPVYNCKKYLPSCLDSILNQSFSDLEIILVDDGSTDGCANICDDYATTDSRIHVVHQLNKGVSAARNSALALVTGDFVSFVDADDTLEPDMYELLISTITQYDADISHCGFNRVLENKIRQIYGTQQIYIHDADQALTCLIGGRLFTGSLWNKLYKAELIQDVSFDETLKANEDILFNYEVFRKAKKIVFADYAKYNYMIRENESACFTTPRKKKLEDFVSVNKYIYSRSLSTQLECVATERYLNGLFVYYKFLYHTQKCACAKVAETIWEVARKQGNLSRRVKIIVWLLHLCPVLYIGMHSVYDRLRTPKWNV